MWGWEEHARVASKLVPAFERECRQKAIAYAIKAYMLNQGNGILSPKQEAEVKTYLSLHKEIPLSDKKEWQRTCIIENKYKGYKIITVDSHAEKLDKVLAKFNITNELAVGVDIQIDILGIARKENLVKLFFIEAKKTNLTLRDLGQLWAYCKLINPEEAFLITSASLGTLNKILNTLKREDLLDYGDGKFIKKMKITIWNLFSNSPDLSLMIPKI